MQRYFLNQKASLNQQYKINNKDDIHHIKNVMRQNHGDKLIVNFLNESFICEINEICEEILITTIEPLDIYTELPVQITIASALLKNDKYEWMIQKATELGAHSFIPFISDHTILKLDDKKIGKKLERFQKIIKEAAEQSYRQIIPTINVVKSSNDLLALFEQFDIVLIAYEESAKAKESSALHQALREMEMGSKVLVIFGPEGGFSSEEIQLFNAPCIGLGPRILRAETAPLYLLSAISYHLELS
ncbi:16S rRNA (uracil(1498)-N(3))-methyltransferase [Macrococcus equi]|uniref:16S rRNA (uracil(1498)-N(3))-methyltransferase n=1 Tax=Macrococcus equi TaxID=3395462 RepID=UPI0039BE7EC3